MIGALACAVPASCQKRTGPDSFLAHEVYDVPGLIAEMKRDPTAAERFAKHFGTSKETVREYFENNLRIKQLPKAAKFTVWGYSPNKGPYPTTQSFAKGTAVFALEDGTPILKYRCGNPLSKALPPVVSVPATQPDEPREAQIVEPEKPPIEETVRAEEPRREPTVTVPSPSDTEIALMPLAPPVVQEEIAGLAQLAFLPATAAGGGGALPWLALIPIGVAGGGGGGGYVIPEPSAAPIAGLLLLSTSAISFRLRFKPQRRR